MLLGCAGRAAAVTLDVCAGVDVVVTAAVLGYPAHYEVVGVGGETARLEDHMHAVVSNTTEGLHALAFVVADPTTGAEYDTALHLEVHNATREDGQMCTTVRGVVFCDTVMRDFRWSADEAGYPDLLVVVEFPPETNIRPLEMHTDATGHYATHALFVPADTVLDAAPVRVLHIYADGEMTERTEVLARASDSIFEVTPEAVDGINDCKASYFESLVINVADCRCRIVTIIQPIEVPPHAPPLVVTRPLSIFGGTGTALNGSAAAGPLFVANHPGADFSVVALTVSAPRAGLISAPRAAAIRLIASTVAFASAPVVDTLWGIAPVSSQWCTWRGSDAEGAAGAPREPILSTGPGGATALSNYMHVTSCAAAPLLCLFSDCGAGARDVAGGAVSEEHTVTSCGEAGEEVAHDACLGGRTNTATGECTCDRGCEGALCTDVRPPSREDHILICYDMGDSTFSALVLPRDAALGLLHHPGFPNRRHSLRRTCADEPQDLDAETCSTFAPAHAFTCNCGIAPTFSSTADVVIVEDAVSVIARARDTEVRDANARRNEYEYAFYGSLFSFSSLFILFGWFVASTAVLF